MGNFHDSAAASDWQVGRAIDTGGNPYGYYDGLIDELYMWDTALDANDATALYNGRRCSGRVDLHPFRSYP